MNARGFGLVQLGLLSAVLSASGCSSDDTSAASPSTKHDGGTGGKPGAGTGGALGGGAGGEQATGGSSGNDGGAGTPADAASDGGVLSGNTVGPSGGTLSFESGDVTFQFPAGAVDKDVTITVTKTPPEPKRWAAIAGTAFTFGPEGITFGKPVHVTIHYAALPDHVDPAMLAIAKGVGAQWKPIHSTSDATAKTVSADLSGFSPYGVVNLGFANIERSCGLTGIGEIWCWDNGWSADKTKFLEPTKVSGELTFAGYDAFADHRKFSSAIDSACGITTSGELWCFAGRQVAYMTAPPPVQLAADHRFAEISIWGGNICGIEAPDAGDGGSSGGDAGGNDANAAYCWGLVGRGNLGIGPVVFGGPGAYATPQKVLGGYDFLHIAVGPDFACGITTDGFTYCWGDETFGQLGRGRGDYTGYPVQMVITLPGQSSPIPLTLVSISAGGNHACGIDSTGRGICWGYNTSGQIGDGSPVTGVLPDPNMYKPPTVIPGGFSWFRLEAGANYTCGVTSAARTYCWGDVHYLGDGRTIQPTDIGVSTPVEVVGQSFFTLANYLAACGMSTSGAPYCWGANDTGQLGIGVADPQPSIYRTTPQKVKTTVLLP